MKKIYLLIAAIAVATIFSCKTGKEKINKEYNLKPNEFNYGALGKIPVFENSHPKVMDDFRAKMDWTDKLNYSKKCILNRDKMKHEKFKYRLITYLERIFNGGKDFFGYNNWNIIKSTKNQSQK